MKKLLVAPLLLLGVALNVSAQNHQVKIIALINKASWCPVCQANGSRFEKDIAPMIMTNKQVAMVANDLSNDKTKASSREMLMKVGVEPFAERHTATGMLYFIDARSKKLISKISIASSDGQIKQTFRKALSKG